MSSLKICAIIATLCLISCSGKALKGKAGNESVNGKSQAAVLFDFNSSKLTEEGKKLLDVQAAAIAKADAGKKYFVEGHCDERGSDAYNMKLGKKRAAAVKKYLVGKGVKASQITTISYGESRPVNLGHDEAAWAQNRRGVVAN
jgi:peptidoglycan-associated lipoprotein